MSIYSVLSGSDQLTKNISVVSWFSGGVTSAVACYLALQQYREKCVVVTIRLESEDEDNWRFLADCEEKLFHQEIVQIQHKEFKSPIDVFQKRHLFQMQGVGAPCTMTLKKSVRQEFEKDFNLYKQVFGYDLTEIDRAERFLEFQPEVELICPLITHNLTKKQCFKIVKSAGIEPPRTYTNFNNANCLRSGCIKGGMGYWNKFREIYPQRFEKMAQLEEDFSEYYRSRGLKSRPTVLRNTSLRNLEAGRGRHKAIYREEKINCDFTCAFDISKGYFGVEPLEIEQLKLF